MTCQDAIYITRYTRTQHCRQALRGLLLLFVAVGSLGSSADPAAASAGGGWLGVRRWGRLKKGSGDRL